jgi:pimeloyl-ACP methyl ester carboxylesterase
MGEKIKLCGRLLLPVLLASTAGCSSFVARRMVQAPNTYPTWLAPKPRVLLGFDSKFLTNFPSHSVEVGPPAARLSFRVVEPADYHLTISSTNWLRRGHKEFQFNFHAQVPGKSNLWTAKPRGTILLLHGYGLAQFAMAPWALRLSQEGWRCVLVDLRGHGRSTGRRIYFGLRETSDLSQLLDALAREHRLIEPVASVGESFGAALSLRWKAADPRVQMAVAIAPYASLSNALLNICHDYAAWVPKAILRAGLKKVPDVLKVQPAELDTTTVLARQPVTALFIAGAEDSVAPVADVKQLFGLAPGSELVVVPEATHEAVTYFFDDLVPPILQWLDRKYRKPDSPSR